MGQASWAHFHFSFFYRCPSVCIGGSNFLVPRSGTAMGQALHPWCFLWLLHKCSAQATEWRSESAPCGILGGGRKERPLETSGPGRTCGRALRGSGHGWAQAADRSEDHTSELQ